MSGSPDSGFLAEWPELGPTMRRTAILRVPIVTPKASGVLPLPSKARYPKLSCLATALLSAIGKDQIMHKIISGTIITLGLAGAIFATAVPASAAGASIHVGGGGVGFTVGNGHYYDRHHHRQSYTYPSDWKAYHHPQNWYRSHPQWNDEHGSDWYRH